VSRDKRAGLAWLRRQFDVDVVLVDDALQTPGLPVDRHLVLLDWERPLGNGWLLPAGRLREPPAALGRAAALLFTRCAGAALPQHAAWSGLAAGGRVFTATEEFAALQTLPGIGVEPASLRGLGVALACGLGRPQAFERLARRLGGEHGFDVRRSVRVGDHAPIEPALRKLLGRLPGLGCSRVLVTRKDALRLAPGPEWDEPLLVLEQRLVVGDLARLVAVLLPSAHSSAKLANSTRIDA
jgi:tetraacyldisaccharide 4'-kinase